MSFHLTSIFSLTAAALMLANAFISACSDRNDGPRKDSRIHTRHTKHSCIRTYFVHRVRDRSRHALFYVGSNSWINTHLSHVYGATDMNTQASGWVCGGFHKTSVPCVARETKEDPRLLTWKSVIWGRRHLISGDQEVVPQQPNIKQLRGHKRRACRIPVIMSTWQHKEQRWGFCFIGEQDLRNGKKKKQQCFLRSTGAFLYFYFKGWWKRIAFSYSRALLKLRNVHKNEHGRVFFWMWRAFFAEAVLKFYDFSKHAMTNAFHRGRLL